MNKQAAAPIRSVAVFCGSRFGASPAYREAAEQLGAGLAAAGLRLIYGGGRIGLMGVVADAVLAGGGSVLGIIPSFLQRREVVHEGGIELVVTENMHDRKRRMFEAADAFVTLPGGFGTFDETIEITTWRQLGLHNKSVLICDVEGWAQPYVGMLQAAVRQGFAEPSGMALFEVIPDVPATLARLDELARPGVGQPERV